MKSAIQTILVLVMIFAIACTGCNSASGHKLDKVSAPAAPATQKVRSHILYRSSIDGSWKRLPSVTIIEVDTMYKPLDTLFMSSSYYVIDPAK